MAVKCGWKEWRKRRAPHPHAKKTANRHCLSCWTIRTTMEKKQQSKTCNLVRQFAPNLKRRPGATNWRQFNKVVVHAVKTNENEAVQAMKTMWRSAANAKQIPKALRKPKTIRTLTQLGRRETKKTQKNSPEDQKNHMQRRTKGDGGKTTNTRPEFTGEQTKGMRRRRWKTKRWRWKTKRWGRKSAWITRVTRKKLKSKNYPNPVWNPTDITHPKSNKTKNKYRNIT